MPDLAALHRVMALYARELEGIERQRVGMMLRIAALVNDNMAEVICACPKRHEHWTRDARGDLTLNMKSIKACERPGVLVDALNALQGLEDKFEKAVVKTAKQHPMAPWIAAQPGIALPTFCKLFGVTGPLDRYANVGKLWHYLGMHVTDGHAPRKGEGIPGKIGGGSYSPRGAGICHVLGETIVRANRGLWREVYDNKKAAEAVTHTHLSAGHRDNRAKRVAVKALLAEMWGEWRRVCPVAHEAHGCTATAAAPSLAK